MGSLGDKIRGLRDRAGLTLEGLAEKIGSTKSYIWELENKEKPRPSADKIIKLAAVLGVTPEFLLDDERQGMPPESDLDQTFFRKYSSLGEKDKDRLRKILDAFDDDE